VGRSFRNANQIEALRSNHQRWLTKGHDIALV
jgi:hypothetical protein